MALILMVNEKRVRYSGNYNYTSEIDIMTSGTMVHNDMHSKGQLFIAQLWLHSGWTNSPSD